MRQTSATFLSSAGKPVLGEEHCVVLVSLFESLDKPGSDSLELPLGYLKLVVLLQV